MTNPLVSVVLPCFNVEKYVKDAMASLLTQSYRHIEIIAIDDCSVDSTLSILQEFAHQDERIRVFHNDKNLNLSTTLNRGIGEAKGDYIVRMDADDVSLPDRIEKQVSYMEEHRDVGISGGSMEIVNEALVPIGFRSYFTDDKSIRQHIFMFSPFSHPAVIIRKSVLDKSGLYNKAFYPAEDYELYFRLGENAKFANLKDTLIRYRVVGNSMTTGNTKNMELMTIKIRKKYYVSYKATLFDKFYNELHRLSVFIIPPRFKIRLFILLRNFIAR